LWYDVFSNKLKEQFGYDRNKFIDEVLKRWPKITL
jgi:hypothetical protein